ncbi:MAG: STAS domain-containing protein [Magnetococcus sp. YQC-5]
MKILYSEDKKHLTVILDEAFDNESNESFRELYAIKKPGIKFIIDFKNVKHMTSSSFGMLLVFRERNEIIEKEDIRLINCNDGIKKLFEMANFQKLFMIS